MSRETLFRDIQNLIQTTLLEQDALIYNGKPFPIGKRSEEVAESVMDLIDAEERLVDRRIRFDGFPQRSLAEIGKEAQEVKAKQENQGSGAKFP